MDGTPHLLTDVKFSERRKGYDPDEVDNFLERVSGAVAQLQDKLRQATARAEEADAKIADAKRAQAVAEAQVDKLKADLSKAEAQSGTGSSLAPGAQKTSDPEATADAAKNLLLMAQKTADGTMEEANHLAKTAVADARSKAATVVAEAERERDKLLAEAQAKAETLVDKRSALVLEEAEKLEHLRSELAGDVEALRSYVEAHREALRLRVHELSRVLDDPEALRLPPTPDVSGATVVGIEVETATLAAVSDDAVADEAVVDEHPVEAPSDDTAETDHRDDTGDADGTIAEATESTEPIEPTAAAPGADTGADAPASSPSPDVESTDRAPSTAGPDQAPVASASSSLPADPEAEFPPVKIPELLEPDSVPGTVFDAEKTDIDLTTERLFGSSPTGSDASSGADSAEAGGPPTELFSPFPSSSTPRGEDESPLGKPDADADEAMRAFFEADFTEEPKPENRSRFGRKR